MFEPTSTAPVEGSLTSPAIGTTPYSPESGEIPPPRFYFGQILVNFRRATPIPAGLNPTRRRWSPEPETASTTGAAEPGDCGRGAGGALWGGRAAQGRSRGHRARPRSIPRGPALAEVRALASRTWRGRAVAGCAGGEGVGRGSKLAGGRRRRDRKKKKMVS